MEVIGHVGVIEARKPSYKRKRGPQPLQNPRGAANLQSTKNLDFLAPAKPAKPSSRTSRTQLRNGQENPINANIRDCVTAGKL